MADIRNDIADLQSKVYGRAMHSSGDDNIPTVPDSWRDNQDNLDMGSGEDFKDQKPWTGGGLKRNRKRKPFRDWSDWLDNLKTMDSISVGWLWQM